MFEDIWGNTLEHLETGGGVMIPLIAVSIVMFLLIVKKYLDLQAFSKRDKPIAEIVKIYHEPGFAAAQWQHQIIEGFLPKRTFNEDMDRNIIESLRLRQEAFLSKDTKTIAILAGVAPLLGLLGTVGGMISTFAVISQFGTGNAKALASGISEALITTQTGLIVAVPGLFLANYLSRRSEKKKERMKRFCLGLLRSHTLIKEEHK
ncbi:MAG: MotA/TolQ/ExbB proton channel family protein [Thermodesulfobacteriota bacterium]